MSSDRAIYIKRHDEYLVRWPDGEETETHIVPILWDNSVQDTALCGFKPSQGWGKRGGSIKLYEVKCQECSNRAKLMGLLHD